MRSKRNLLSIIIGAIFIVAFLMTITNLIPFGRKALNQWDYSLKKVDEKTYDNQKTVEDTLRSYLASYEADKITYMTYKDSTDTYEAALAKSSKVRAIQTATYYNEYLSKNSFVWKDNKPDDLPDMLSTEF
jgi:hypothetical protein